MAGKGDRNRTEDFEAYGKFYERVFGGHIRTWSGTTWTLEEGQILKERTTESDDARPKP